MKKKITLKSIIIWSSVGIVLLIALLLLIISIATYKPTAAFYGIDEKTKTDIETLLQTTLPQNGKKLPYKIVVLDDSTTLEKALKKAGNPELLFIHNGLNAKVAQKRALKKKAYFDESVLNGMTTSVKNATKAQNPADSTKITAVPLLLDHYEIDVSTAKLASSSMAEVRLFDDLESFARLTKNSTAAPIVFAGGEDRVLIDVFAAITEVLSGEQAVRAAQEKICALIDSGNISINAFHAMLSKLIQPENEFAKSFETLRRWQKAEIIPRNVLQLKDRDITAFLSANLTAVSFMTLSSHRKIDYSVISRYESFFIPSVLETSERNLMAPMIVAVPLKKNADIKNSIKLLADNLQPQLARRTGLAPVQAQSSVPDKQSDDVRYWVAASNAPMPSFCDSCFKTKKVQAAFAEALRTVLANN